MKLKTAWITIILTAVCLAGAAQDPAPEPAKPEAPERDMKKICYAFGVSIGMQMEILEDQFELDSFFEGVRDGIHGEDTKLTSQETTELRTQFMQVMNEVRTKVQKAAEEKNRKEGDAFLAENEKKPGVKTTESGLQYLVVEEGTGRSPGPTDLVTVHYTGTLLDGTEFDSSRKRGKPASFPLNGVIKGWTEGLQLMKEGGKSKLFIPFDLAYGPRGKGKTIGPYATLIFDIELISVEPNAPSEPKSLKKSDAETAGKQSGKQ